MKKTVLALLINFLGYAQNPDSNTILNFEDGLKINLEERLKYQDTDFNPSENLDFTAIKSTQHQTQTERESEITFRLDMSKTVVYNSTAITKKYERTYDTNSNPILTKILYWDALTASFVFDKKTERTFDINDNITLDIRYSWDTETEAYEPNYKFVYNWSEDQKFEEGFGYEFNTET